MMKKFFIIFFYLSPGSTTSTCPKGFQFWFIIRLMSLLAMTAGSYTSLPNKSEKQMTYLRDHGFTLLTFDKWAEKKRVEKPIFITFDDGYKNNINAFVGSFRNLKRISLPQPVRMLAISDFISRSNRLSEADLRLLAHSGLFSIRSFCDPSRLNSH